MSDVVIRVENLCKEYRLGTISHGTLYRDLQSGWAKFRGKEDPNTRIDSVNRVQLNNTNDRFFALNDISFDIRQGEIVGVIGRNGAGKSTLLKILSRVTSPTTGTVKIKGRVASLLEVGTGFHPELTGRENIFLNGAILGMHKKEIEQKFEEIVKFAEIDKFIDTPVKRYSSGMYVRLAFAVAAHLDPEILIVDEVLAVGDADFQRKCLGKMGDVAKEGRTVIFVSHNMGAITDLCQRAILIHEGKIIDDGSSKQIVSKYLSGTQPETGKFDLTEPSLRWKTLPDSRFKWTYGAVLNSEEKLTSQIRLREPFSVILQGFATAPIRNIELAFTVKSGLGFILFNSIQVDAQLPTDYQPGPITFRVTFSPNLFGPGEYLLDLFATSPYAIDYIRAAVHFSVQSVNEITDCNIRDNYAGVILYPCTWTIEVAN